MAFTVELKLPLFFTLLCCGIAAIVLLILAQPHTFEIQGKSGSPLPEVQLVLARPNRPLSQNGVEKNGNPLPASEVIAPIPSRNDLPNIVYIMVDDMGNGDVNYNGGKADTPNLDALAKGPNSIKLTRHYSGGPTCSPTRGTVLTGRNHNRYCIWGVNYPRRPMLMPLPPSEVTVGEILQKHGYLTAMFGKWHIGDLKPFTPSHKNHKKWPVSHPGMFGFDKWWVTPHVVPTVRPNCVCFKAKPCYTSTCTNYFTIVSGSDKLISYPKLIEDSDSQFLLQLSDEFISEALQSGKPFFVYLPLHAIHDPYFMGYKKQARYTSRGFGKREADYLSSITDVDDMVGNFRELLKKYNISNNTLFWFTSDNGPDQANPGKTGGLRAQKGTVYEGGIRVPGIIEWPAVIHTNRVADFPVVTNDLLPTACDIVNCSLPTNRPLDGTSILPLLRGESSLRNKTIPWAYGVSGNFNGSFSAALGGDKYKIVARFSNGVANNVELFDLTKDKGEKNNISAAHPDIAQSMKQELEEWLQSAFRSAKQEVDCLGYSFTNRNLKM